jgi:hypothetical protein
MKQKQQERFKKFAVREADLATIAPRFIAGTETIIRQQARKMGDRNLSPTSRALISFPPLFPSAEALGYSQSSATRTLPAAMLTVLFHFFRAPLANLTFGLEWNDPASILRNFVPVGTMIRATISAGGQTPRRN